MKIGQAVVSTAVAVALLTFCGMAFAHATSGWRVVARSSSMGGDALLTSPTIRRFQALALRVTATSGRKVQLQWRLTCWRGAGAGVGPVRNRNGALTYRATSTPLFRVLRLPLTHPTACGVGVSASTAAWPPNASVRIQLLKK
jgi:hypothetical protein